MYRYLTLCSAITFALFLSSCGISPTASQSLGVNNPQAAAPGTDSTCPLYFPSENLCAGITWTAGPTADGESSFEVSFWNKETGTPTGPLVEPSAQVGSFIRMTCCGSLSFPTVNKTEAGKYSVTKVSFLPGTWEVFVQLKNGTSIEKQFITVKLNE